MPRVALAVALALAVPTVAAAQAPSDALFRAYVLGSAPVALGPLSVEAPTSAPSTGGAAGERERSDEDDTAGPTRTPWLAGGQRYALGGVAAIAAGVALSQYAAGAQGGVVAAGAAGDHAAMPTAFGLGGTLPPGLALDPAIANSTSVTVNPEPGTVLLLGTGLGGLFVVARRRRRAS